MSNHLLRLGFALVPALGALVASPAQAGDVIFTGLLVNSCVVNITTPGGLGATSEGNTLSSELGSGVPAVLAVVAVGAAPTLSFAAPTLETPSGFSGTPSVAIRYQSTSGHSQAYTSGASTMTGGTLLDTVTINSRVQNSGGFTAGRYRVVSTVTCQQ